MANYLENGLRAMEKSLREVVLPALDPTDPLAREQLNLTVDYLAFLRVRIDHATHHVVFELAFYRDMAADLIELAGDLLPTGPIRDALEAAAPLGRDMWQQPAELRMAITRLAGAVDELVAAAGRSGDEVLRSRIDRSVHAATEYWIDFNMSWYAPIAVDPDAPGLRPLTDFFPYRRRVPEVFA